MFIIVDDRQMQRFYGTRINIGRADQCDLVLQGSKVADLHAQLSQDEVGIWRLTQLSVQPTQVNRKMLSTKQTVKVCVSDEILIGERKLQIRYADRGDRILAALRQKTFELEADLHQAILDKVRNQVSGVSDRQYRESVESVLDSLLATMELNTDLEIYLASEALREMLGDRIHGFGNKEAQNHHRSREKANLKRFAPLVLRLEQTLQFDPDEKPVQKLERVEWLLPWAIQVNRNLFSSRERRELALGWLREQLVDVIFGLGPLEDLLYAEGINDIMVLPTGEIFLDRNGLQDSGRKMLSAEVSRRIVERIVTRESRRIDQSSPMVDARMADGSRLNAIIDPVSVNGPCLTIRKFPMQSLTVDDLIEKNSLTRAVANFLRACVLARKNIVLAGGTGSGKTTLLNCLASYIPDHERIVTVEDTAEIQLTQNHVVTLQAKPPNLEGKNPVTIRQLVRNTLRMRPDRIIVGECRGGEALDMLQAMNTGHDGSLTTIHANTPPDAVRRLEVMAMEAEGIDLPSRALREQISSAVDLLVQVERLSTGRRAVTSICEVVSLDEEDGTVILEEIYKIRRHKKKGRLAQTKLAFTGFVPTFIDELLQTGIVTIESLF
jgi:pilus assembly protein CpaF